VSFETLPSPGIDKLLYSLENCINKYFLETHPYIFFGNISFCEGATDPGLGGQVSIMLKVVTNEKVEASGAVLSIRC
jgi:hypothetical protein